MHNQKNTRLFGNVENFLFHLRLAELSIINKNHTKVKSLFEKQTFTPCAVSVRTLSDKQTQSNTVRKARLEPAIRDAQKLAQNVFPPEEQGMVFSVLDRNPLQ